MADLSSFESCSASVRARRSSPNCSRTGPSTAASRCFSSSIARLDADLHARGDVLLASSPSTARGRARSSSSSTIAAASRRPFSWMRSQMRVAVRAPRARRSAPCRATSPCRPAGAGPPAPRRACGSRRARGRAPRGARPRAPRRRRPRPSSGRPSCRRRSGRASTPPSLLVVGLTTSSPSIRPTRTAPTGPKNGQRRDHQRRGRAVDAEDVVRRDEVGGQHGADHLHLVAEALRPERPDRAVDHARRQRRPLGRAALALEEAAGIFPAAYVRSSTSIVSGKKSAPSRASGRPVAVASTIVSPERIDDRAVGLLGELAGLEGDLLAADLDGDRGGSAPLQYSSSLPPLCLVESGSLGQPRTRRGARPSFHSPVELTPELSPQA